VLPRSADLFGTLPIFLASDFARRHIKDERTSSFIVCEYIPDGTEVKRVRSAAVVDYDRISGMIAGRN
jgi:hypothetical protein